MALDLDLSASRSKLERAVEHLRCLQREFPRVLNHDPVSFRAGEIDQDTGRVDFFGTLHQIDEPTLSVIAGDYIQNLRAALDYIVTALVEKSGANLVSQHQFPISTSGTDYAVKVGTRTQAKADGPLRGVVYGLAIIEDFQPYRDDPHADSHPLALLNRFANTDKHRQLLRILPRPSPHRDPQLSIDLHGGTAVELWQTDDFKLPLNQETKLASMRLVRPFPPKVSVQGALGFFLTLGVPDFPPRYPTLMAVTVEALEEIGACVETAIAALETL